MCLRQLGMINSDTLKNGANMNAEQSILSYRFLGACISAVIAIFALLALFFNQSYGIYLLIIAVWMLLLSIFLSKDDIKKSLPAIKDIGSGDAYYIIIPRYFLLGSYLFLGGLIKKKQNKPNPYDNQ